MKPVLCSRVWRAARALVACVFIGSLLGACGSRDGESGSLRAASDLHLPLSNTDRAYLASLPVLRVGVDPKWAPMAYIDPQGRLHGISADYLDFLHHTLHVRFELMPTRSWAETLRYANEGRIDVVIAASSVNGLASGFKLSMPYVRYPLVIVTRETAPFIGGLADLEGAQVAIVGEGRTAPLQTTSLKGAHIVPVGSADEGLETVARGRAFAYIGNLGVVDRIVRERYAGTLRVASPADRVQDLSFAVAPRFAPLVPLIDNVLAAIPEIERERIQNSWLSSRFTFGVAPRTLWLVLLPVGSLTVLFLGILWFNMARLRKEVRERRRTERELIFETGFKALLMNTVPIPVCVKDEQGRYIAVNPAYEQALGVDAASLIGKSVPPARAAREFDVDALGPAVRTVVESGRPAQGEIHYVDTRGMAREAVYWARACSGDDDRVAVLFAFVDVSDLRGMERRELELKQRLVELTEALPSVVFQLRFVRERRPRFELLFANRRADEWLGPDCTPAGERFDAFFRSLGAAQRRRLTRLFLRSAGSLERVSTEFELERGDLSRWWFHVEAAPRMDEDGTVQWSGYLHDLTQAKEAQATLIAAKHHAEEAALARDAFIATVSHEIRTPMGTIVGILQLLQHDGLPADDRRLVAMAGDAAELLLRILNDILDFAKSENGELSLESAPMSIEQIVRRCAALVKPDAEGKGLDLRVDVSRYLAPRHVGDAQRIGQVLLNLLGNAIKFTNTGFISLAVELIGQRAGHQLLSIRVADTGIGIADHDQARLFVPFSQAPSAVVGGQPGTGLGLAICKRLIEQMGGSIALVSEPGRGTTIEITLTLSVDRDAGPDGQSLPHASEASNAAAAPASASTSRVLLVEDRSINREVLKRQLASLHVIDCDAVENGAQALEAYEHNEYAIIITDCAMPLINGVELIEAVRQRERGGARRTALIALTADARQRQRDACLEAGADEVCVKPLKLERLRALLARHGIIAARTGEPARAGAPLEPPDLRRRLRRSLAADLRALLGAVSAGDRATMGDIVHSIAGTAAWFELHEVARAATNVQQCLDENRAEDSALQVLRVAIERAIDSGEAFDMERGEPA